MKQKAPHTPHIQAPAQLTEKKSSGARSLAPPNREISFTVPVEQDTGIVPIQKKENKTIARHSSSSQQVVQRYELKQIEKYELGNLLDLPKVKELGWDEASLDELVAWARNYKQINSTLQNVKREAWEKLKPLGSGEALNNQVLTTSTKGKDQKTTKALTNANTIQALPKVVMPLANMLAKKHGETIWPELKTQLPVIQKAYGIGTGSAAEIIAAQKSLQTWLLSKLSVGEVMSAQRSVGFEFEFARYDANDNLESHEVLGKSQVLSPLFKLPFVLETDSGKELEIGMPPLLIGLVNGGPDKVATGKLWATLRAMMGTIRDAHTGKTADKLPLAANGIGTGWAMTPDAAKLTVVKGRPGKAEKAKDQVYSQMNISLTPAEIAKFTAGKGKKRYQSYSHEFFGEAYDDMMKIFGNLDGEQSKVAAINISKGLSHLLAIPSINMFADRLHEYADYDVSSTVKETFGIWIKDSIPNIADNSLTDGDDRKEIRTLLTAKKAEIETKMGLVLAKAMVYIGRDMPYGDFPKKPEHIDDETYRAQKIAEYESAFKTELTLTLDTLINRLKARDPVYTENEGGEFGKERFPTRDKKIKIRRKKKKVIKAKGEGVRKETYVNIPQGEGEQEHMHLAEIRNENYMEDFLAD